MKWDFGLDFHSPACEFSGNFSPGRLQCVKFDGRIKVAKNAWGHKVMRHGFFTENKKK